jgi:hypothetical protein
MSIRRAAVLLAVALVVGVILGAQPLRSAAEGLSSSALRSVALTVTWPFGKISEGLHVEAGRQWLLDAFEGEGGEIAEGAAPVADHGPDSGPPPGPPPTTAPSLEPEEGTAPGHAAVTTSTTDGRPRVDARHPLHVLVVGDSLVSEVAKGMVRASEGLPLQVEYRYKVSSGLVNTGFFDWPAELKGLVRKYKPDVTVFMYGNNDHLSLMVDGKPVPPLEPAWLGEYERRVEAMAGVADRAGSKIVWIGMPIMRSTKYSGTARSLNKVFSGVCKDEGYWYLDSYRLFSDKSGKYAPYLLDASGKSRLMRGTDRIHLTEAGGDKMAREIVRILRKHYLIES